MKTNGLVWSAALALATFVCPLSHASEEGVVDRLLASEEGVISLDSPEQTQPVIDARDIEEVARCNCHNFPWFAGTEFTYFKFHANNGGIINASFSDTTAPGVSTRSFVINEYENSTFTPRLWVGRRIGDTWSVVGRYWNLNQFSEDVPTPTTATGTNFATFRQESFIEMYTADIEIVKQCEIHNWRVDLAAGVRQADFEMQQSLYGFGVFTSGNFINLYLANGAHVRALGVSAAITARRQLWDTNAHFFGTILGSALDGATDSYGRSSGSVASSPSAPLVGAATVSRNNATDGYTGLEIVEVQLGIQWEHELRDLSATFFFRTAFEYQSWIMEGPPTGGAGFGGTIGEITTNSFASAGLGGAELYGISIATGLTW